MNGTRFVVALLAVLLLATGAQSAAVDFPPATGGVLIVLGDGSEVRVGWSARIEATAQAMAMDHATGRMECRGEVRIRILRDGSEAITITTSSAVITRVAPEKAP